MKNEQHVHFAALSLGCASSPRIRIYQPETLDEDLQQASIEYLTTNAPKNSARMQASVAAGKGRVAEVILLKLFKWHKDDFGFSKQEILAYYASFMPDGMREELLEVALSNNFVIKYDKFDWSLHLTKADPGDTCTSTLGANQAFTPLLHEVGGSGNTNIADKPAGQARNAYRVPGAQQPQQGGCPDGFMC